MQIDWWTLALQAVNFLILVWLLVHFLFRPATRIIERRKQVAREALEEAVGREQAADAARSQLEAERVKLEDERRALRERLQHEGEAERHEVLEAARREADNLLAAARDAVAGERARTLDELRGQVTELAATLTGEILRGTDPALANEASLTRLEQHFQRLPEDERGRLRTDAHPAGVTVATAAAVPAPEQTRWRDRIGRLLGEDVQVSFTIDQALLGGAELRLPHAVLSFTWRDQLERGRALLEHDDVTS